MAFFGGFPHYAAMAWELFHAFRRSNRENPRPFFVLVPDESVSEDIQSSLSAFLDESLIFHLPPFDFDLVKHLALPLPLRKERLRFLHSFYFERKPGVYLVPLASLLTPFPHGSFFSELGFQISKGGPLTRAKLLEKLECALYLPAPVVENAFQYCARGSIVDVFSPHLTEPIRIELYEDVVQSIRHFHPGNQRQLAEIETVSIAPAREFRFDLLNADTVESALNLNGWTVDEWAALRSKLEERFLFPTVDYWGPLIESSGLPTEAGPNEKPLPFAIDIMIEPDACALAAKRVFKDISSFFENARIEGEWVPPPQVFFVGERPWIEAQTTIPTWYAKKDFSALATEPAPRYKVEIESQQRLALSLSSHRNNERRLPLDVLEAELRRWNALGFHYVFTSPSMSQLERLGFLLAPQGIRLPVLSENAALLFDPSATTTLPVAAPTENHTQGSVHALVAHLENGFIDQSRKIAFLNEEEFFGTRKAAFSRRNSAPAAALLPSDLSLIDLKPGDLVIHHVHGVGRFLNLKTMAFDGQSSELLEVEYKNNHKLLLPVTRLNTIQKYVGGGETQLDALGGLSWEQKKSKAKKELYSIAGELLSLYSQRKLAVGPQMKVEPAEVERFAATFPYDETKDQASAITAVLEDLQKSSPMERLVCGDVGYGKTEVAIRAAHFAVSAGYQVAVLSPTTLLTLQHESNFRRRLGPLGIQVASVSRFNSADKNRELMGFLKQGKIDVMIGTHRLLGADVAFKNLGLLVVDEEQRFGVVHKEKLKRFRTNIHVLTMTATPIPRTLNLSMSGLKEISLITTPPANRLSVKTFIAKKKPSLIAEAIQQELQRGGQVYYLHNRIMTMNAELALLRELLPEASIDYAHGQMGETELEEKMLRFYQGKTSVLLTTSIIESGLDVPNANTLIVDDADRFGLAQLYQIRGRVGRSDRRAYAYFLLPSDRPITRDAEERLHVLESYQELGSGFAVASHDLDLRGAGDLLGREQSGKISAIGFDTYVELLQECLADLRGEAPPSPIDPELTLPIDLSIPHDYIPDTGLRLVFYRKLATAQNEHDVDDIARELEDRFGSLGPSTQHLVSSMRIKCQARRLHILTLKSGPHGISLSFAPTTPVAPQKLIQSMERYPHLYQLLPDGRLLLRQQIDKDQDPTAVLRRIESTLTQLESWCQ